MDNREQQQSWQRRNASNTQSSTNPQQNPQPAPPHVHRPQGHQSNLASPYPGPPQVGASSNYGLPNPQPGNPPHGHQLQGQQSNVASPYPGAPDLQLGTSNSNRGLPNSPYVHQQGYPDIAVDPHAGHVRSPVGVDGGSISQTSPNLLEIRAGNRNPEMTGQQLTTPAPALQRSRSSQRGQLAQGQEWNSGNHDASANRVQPQQYNIGAPAGPSQAQPFVTGNIPSSAHPTNDAGGPRCKLPGCGQPRFFYNRIQELLEYCEGHLATAIETRFAAPCRKCGRLPVLENSNYCSRFCSNADRAERERVRRQPSVPTGFAPACQECRRPITENMEVYDGRFCSRQCWNAHRSSRH